MVLKGIEDFLDFRDADGVSNREKIEANQHIIRRIATTDKNRSYEDSDGASHEGPYPAGVVVVDGELIGFGINIFNEDIYPLKSFEIYLRNCGLAGDLDLSGNEGLLFVDIYHNKIKSIDVSGDRSLKILGIQDNEISELDTSSLGECLGIDAGKNRLETLDLSSNRQLVELYINDNGFAQIDLTPCPGLKYFYCHNNRIGSLDTTANPLLRHLDATGNPMREIRSLAPQREERLPVELTADGPGFVGLKFNPVYNAQWKETGEWQQSYHAYPEDGAAFEGWFGEDGSKVSDEEVWYGTYGESRVMTARFR